MKLAWSLGILFAVVLHVGVLLFGGLLFMSKKGVQATLQQVELLSDDASTEKENEKKKEAPPETREELKTDTEQPPDAAEIVRNLELSAAAEAPALEAVSLSAIEQALSGQSGGGEFGDALSFSSGGRIGGTGTAGAMDENLESAFTLAEIDQKPRAVFQAAPLYPAEMRGKKVEGSVIVIFVVDSDGKVTSPRVEKSSHPAFEKPAVDAVKQWKFEPAVKAGQRVDCKVRVPIRFQPS
ncbi:MAG: energy transducer TonB [Planctomycetes bacterium]|nr:energy transducer TonB [Planctomycetota bacterium]MBI3847890.1 energy transducer TonB [Planctomycetota bacterium]